MDQSVRTVTLALPFRLGWVNCYFVTAGNGLVLIDSGASNGRRTLERELERAGCHPGDLKLIVLTHGDSDHTGSAAYLRRKYGAPVAMHREDAGMMERGDIFHSRRGRG